MNIFYRLLLYFQKHGYYVCQRIADRMGIRAKVVRNPLIKLFRSKIYTALIMLIVIMFIGVLGYRFISGYSWVNAVYMTVITITTVGFAEVNPLDTPSKIFTIFLILASVVIVGYAISIITEYILSRNNFEDIKKRKMQKTIDNMSNHIIICGFGRNGKQAAKKLLAYNKPFVIIVLFMVMLMKMRYFFRLE